MRFLQEKYPALQSRNDPNVMALRQQATALGLDIRESSNTGRPKATDVLIKNMAMKLKKDGMPSTALNDRASFEAYVRGRPPG